MSGVSVFFHKLLHLPEVNILGNPIAAAVVGPMVAELESELVTNKLPAVLDSLPRQELAALTGAFVAALARADAKAKGS